MENGIRRVFGERKTRVEAMSPLTLAFVGDAVHALIISTMVVNMGNTRNSKLHERTSAYVSARAQSRVADELCDKGLLTEEELAVLRRGVNAKPHSQAKNATNAQYHKATGLEALCGYLYLKGETDRLLELIKAGMQEAGL